MARIIELADGVVGVGDTNGIADCRLPAADFNFA